MPRAKDSRQRRGERDEYEVEYFTREPGRPLQRKMLQRRLDALGDDSARASHHVEETPPEPAPPREDRAG